jgi:hypothetical protein
MELMAFFDGARARGFAHLAPQCSAQRRVGGFIARSTRFVGSDWRQRGIGVGLHRARLGFIQADLLNVQDGNHVLALAITDE